MLPLTQISAKENISSPEGTENTLDNTTADVRMHDLKGNVRQAITYKQGDDPDDMGEKVSFTRAGKWTSLGADAVYDRYKRDVQGRLISVEITSGEELTTYQYNTQGQLTQSTYSNPDEGKYIMRYTYDANGDRVKQEISYQGDTNTFTYKILKRDSHGNWTCRQQVSQYGTEIVLRTITYWQ